MARHKKKKKKKPSTTNAINLVNYLHLWKCKLLLQMYYMSIFGIVLPQIQLCCILIAINNDLQF